MRAYHYRVTYTLNVHCAPIIIESLNMYNGQNRNPGDFNIRSLETVNSISPTSNKISILLMK